MSDIFHQTVEVELVLPSIVQPGRSNRLFKELGAYLNYDVYSFKRKAAGPEWQSESFIHVHLFLNGEKVDAQDSIDRVVLRYPLATIGSEYISEFANQACTIAKVFCSAIKLFGVEVTDAELIAYCESCVSDLMENFGEEPGSRNLAILIESNY